MKNEIIRQLATLGIMLFIALPIWRYYRRRTFPLIDRYSSFGPRFWTGIVDFCVLWPIGFISSVSFFLNIPRSLAALLIIVNCLAWLLYTVVMHARYGQTIGKMVTKVRVVDFRTEGRISFRQAWLREGIPMVLSLGFLGYEVLAVLTGRLTPGAVAKGEALDAVKLSPILMVLPGLWYVAEILTMLTNEKRRALHDFIAGTVVVRTNIEEESPLQGAPMNAGSGVASSASVSYPFGPPECK